MFFYRRFIIDLIVAEAYAAMKVVVFGRDMGLYTIILESDALEIIHVLRKEEQSCSKHGTLIDDLELILHNIQSWQVLHTRREANMAAHVLAKAAF